jgi:probable F420-dependent oxidoreductase
MSGRAFRFGVVVGGAGSGEDWVARARRIESLGYATLVVPDGLNYTLAPLPALATAAVVTTSLRVGTYVVANDYRNPVLLAKEAATLDLLSGGRFELGVGAGRPRAAEDNRMLGIPFDGGAVRVARLEEALGLLDALLSGRPATAPGPHYAAADARVSPGSVQRPRPPILVAGWGRKLLLAAARCADIVALGMPPTADQATTAERIGWLRSAAGERFDQIELNVNLMAVGDRVPGHISRSMGLDAAALARGGSVAAVTGSVDEMCETLLRRREALGLSYLMVGEELMDELAPVVERLAGR